MRIVLDTNVVVSALLWGGVPERLIQLAGDGEIDVFTSIELLDELAGILRRPKFQQKLAHRNVSADEIVARYRELAETVDTGPLVEMVALRDPDDLAVLACALAARADAIVSGDDDLHALGVYKDTVIISPAECLHMLGIT